MNKPLVLCILDGCGIRKETDGNAFKNANTPTFDKLIETYPNSLLEASGIYVGLPKNQMGNSEVGHLNIGAGRLVYQPLELINNSIKDGTFFKNKKFLEVFEHVKKNNSKLHIMGLLSNGGVHSHIDHLFALIDMIKQNEIKEVYYHIFLDGRDTDPKSGINFIKLLEKKLEETGLGNIATICGRYYAMDRDNNYDRLKEAYDVIVRGVGTKYTSPEKMIMDNYSKGITDEFMHPGIINAPGISEGDGIITFNFRRDRLRELATAITNPDASELDAIKIENLKVLTMFSVTNTVLCQHAFDDQNLFNTLGEYLETKGLSQLRIAETEKYAHVTYFFDGGREKDFKNSSKKLIPSPKVPTYDMKPEMSAKEITDTLIDILEKNTPDVVILNYANGDMLGHTGNYNAAVNGIEFLDTCLNRVYKKTQELNGTLIVTADHGNCEIMWDEKGHPVTSHTTSKVPFIVTKNDIKLRDGVLADIAPTILELLDLECPKEMTGKSLIE